MNAIEWIDGFHTRHVQASMLNPNHLIVLLGNWLGVPWDSRKSRVFFKQGFDDFMRWFQSDLDIALESFVYTEDKVQAILNGYARHLAHHDELTANRYAQLQRLADVYGDGSPVAGKIKVVK